ncbi:MAG: hypothetical protein HZR80_09985 [Candidatus Heimdallarchaeota archaeon]
MNESGDFESLIVRTVECLNETVIEYCIVGAIAASYYGSVRSTEDLDVIINLSNTDVKQIKHLVSCLKAKEIDLIESDMVQGLKEKSHITAFDTRTYFYRIDFKGIYSLLDKETMNTKVQVTILDDLNIWLTPPELQIIAKLLPGMSSEKDILDIKNILLNYKENLDVKLLENFAKKFNVEKELNRLL